MKKKYDVFISYRREGGQDTARIIRDELRAKGFRVFFDVETLRSGKFNLQLLETIRECNDFILVCSPGALDRCSDSEDWVRQELACALANKKNVIPVMLRNFEFPPADTLPEDIREVYYCNGLPASHEHFDSFITKLVGFLTPPKKMASIFRSLPFNGRRMAITILVFLILAGAVSFGGYQITRGPSVFPGTTEEISCTDRLIAYSMRNLTVYDNALRVFNEGIEELIKYTKGTSDYQKKYTFDEYAGSCLDKILAEREKIRKIDEVDAALVQDISTTLDGKINAADANEMEDALTICIDEMLNSISCFARIYCKNGGNLNDSTLVDGLEQYKKIAELDRDGIFLAFNDMLLSVDNQEVLDKIKREQLPELTSFYIRQEWKTNATDIRAQMESIFHTQSDIINKAKETLAFDDEQLENLKDAINKVETTDDICTEKEFTAEGQDVADCLNSLDGYISLLENRKTIESILYNNKKVASERYDKMIEKLKESRDSLFKKYTYLESLQSTATGMEDELKMAKENLKNQYQPLETDDAGLLWGKAQFFLKFSMTDVACECYDMYPKAKDADENADIYAGKAKYFAKNQKKTKIKSGVIVCSYEPGKREQKFEIGDILYAVDGKPVNTGDEFTDALHKGKTPVSVLRFDADGGFKKLKINYDSDCARIALLDMRKEGAK